MGVENDEILNKLTSAMKNITEDYSPTKLNAEQQDNFIQVVQESTPLLEEARMMTMTTPERDIDRTGFGGRILQAPADNPEDNVASGPDFYTNTLEATKVKAIVPLKDDTLEDNLEREGFEDTLVEMIADRAGLDMEELFLLGREGLEDLEEWSSSKEYEVGDMIQDDDGEDVYECIEDHTSDSDNKPGDGDDWSDYWFLKVRDEDKKFFSLLDGWMTNADHVITADDIGDTHDPEKIMDLLFQALPRKYIRQRGDWRYWASYDIEDDYRNKLRDRSTALGDTAQTEGGDLVYKGIPVATVGNMNTGEIMLGHPDNTVYGIRRDIRIESEREAKHERTDFIVTLRVDAHFEDEKAVAASSHYDTEAFDFDY